MATEKRLIDADALSVRVMDASYWDNQDEDVIWNLVQDAPTVDAVEVVRCKDCDWWCDGQCRNAFAMVSFDENHFCSYGERKDNG